MPPNSFPATASRERPGSPDPHHLYAAGPDFFLHRGRRRMPRLDDPREYSRAGSRGRDPLRFGETFHPRRNHPLGPTARSRFRSQRPRQRHAASGRQRLHRAGWRRDAHPAQRARRKEPRNRRTDIILRHHASHCSQPLLGLTAAAANVFGGAIIVQKHWDRSYLKYFVALGAGFMLATAMVEVFPAQSGIKRQERGIPGSRGLPDHSLLRAHGHAAFSLRRRNPQRPISSTATRDIRFCLD